MQMAGLVCAFVSYDQLHVAFELQILKKHDDLDNMSIAQILHNFKSLVFYKILK